MALSTTPPKDYIQDPRFNHTIELPPSSFTAEGRSGPFKVTYADYGYRNITHPEEERVFLFFGPLMGSRLFHIAKDELAKQHKIRIIHPDRPGVGGTDPLDDSQSRMRLWREVIMALLRQLNIPCVAGIGCHSGGTISAVDMLVHHPEILDPGRAVLSIGAPWILPKHSGVTGLSLVQNLPTFLIGQTDKFARLINGYVGPAVGKTVGFSAGILRGPGPRIMAQSSAIRTTDDEPNGDNSASSSFEEKLWPHVIDRIYGEGVRGIGHDAVMFMQKGKDMESGWSDWGDYDTGLKRLVSAWRGKRRRLRVDVFYAEDDALVGPGGGTEKEKGKGPRWFDGCWEEACKLITHGGGGEVELVGVEIDYKATTVRGADHDSIWDIKWGVAEQVFKTIAEEDVEI
ncbi:hypothetical protein V8F20_006663 [Naviculisporaceae sp. PSN 640]